MVAIGWCDDGRLRGRIDLGPELGSLFDQALQSARAALWRDRAGDDPDDDAALQTITTVAAADRLLHAAPLTIAGRALRSVVLDEWRVLATTDTPTVVVSGSVDEPTLLSVLGAVEVLDATRDFTLHVRSLPDGYTQLVPPTVLGADDPTRRSLAGSRGSTAIHEVSDWTDPLLAAAASGADLREVDVGGTTGWTGVTTMNPYGPIRFLDWSPRPGVVFELATGDLDRDIGELVDLATATTALEVDAWDRRYG